MSAKKIEIPDYCLVLLVGPSGCGKSTFAAKHFLVTEIVSSDYCRGVVADDENDQSSTGDAFDLLHHIVGLRLKRRRLTVVDATNVRSEDRAKLVKLARQYHALCVAFVFDIDTEICIARNETRADRPFGGHVVRNHARALRRGLKRMRKEGVRFQYRFKKPAEMDAVEITRQPLWTDKRAERGPFDIIGDIHGCAEELEILLGELGYVVKKKPAYRVTPPQNRRAIFVGDLVDRGPRTPDVLRIVKHMVDSGSAFCVAGNHENKLVRALNGRNVKVSHGLAESLEQLEQEDPAFVEDMRGFMDGLVSHYVLDGGELVVAHAGLREDMQGRSSGAVRAFCLYGETSGETDEFGLPVRYDWARDYRGRAKVIYGHTPVPEAEWVNGTLCIDTGCVFGGKLTAFRYPELELVQVPAAKVYCEPVRPLAAETSAESAAGQLFLSDVIGKRAITVDRGRPVMISAAQAAAALEQVSRFAIDPRWLIYLPPTMSPAATSTVDGFLERPEEAFEDYAANGVTRLICEEKHMGSRAVLVVCRDEAAAAKRFGVNHGIGAVYTRTGRAFFPDPAGQLTVLQRLARAAETSGLFDDLSSDWLLLDAEVMPWSAKAQGLIEGQYAAVGAAAETALTAANRLLAQANARGVDIADLEAATEARKRAVDRYRSAYHPYVWPVQGIDDLRIAGFHILASEHAVHRDRDHVWHLGQCRRLAETGDSLFQATDHRIVNSDDLEQRHAAIEWWLDLTSRGGEGMVVKPFDFIHAAKKFGWVQPAMKVRGQDYLRIIYGPDYDLPENLSRLRRRGLGKKRSLAMREFKLGLEALTRFVNREPLSRVHECVVGVLAMESEPVDPRL